MNIRSAFWRFFVGALFVGMTPALADPPFGPSTTVQQSGSTVVPATHILNFTGCTITHVGSTAQISACGGTGTVSSVASGDSTVVLTPDPIVGSGTVKVNQAFNFVWTGAQSWSQSLTLNGTGANKGLIYGAPSATFTEPVFGTSVSGSALYFTGAAPASTAGAYWAILGQNGASGGYAGSSILIEPGAGTNGSGGQPGGGAGSLTFFGANGGDSSNIAAPGRGGGVTFVLGNTGANNGGGADYGGSWNITAGNGSAATASGSAGQGGFFLETAGTGGNASGSSSAGVGGSYTLQGGSGGNGSASKLSGNGGSFTITSGSPGTSGGGGTGVAGNVGIDTGLAASGTINLGSSNAHSVAIGNSSATTTVTGTFVTGSGAAQLGIGTVQKKFGAYVTVNTDGVVIMAANSQTTLPPNPVEGQIIDVIPTAGIATATIVAAGGQSLSSIPALSGTGSITCTANHDYHCIYRNSDTTWYCTAFTISSP